MTERKLTAARGSLEYEANNVDEINDMWTL
jgi:hypothetical protein